MAGKDHGVELSSLKPKYFSIGLGSRFTVDFEDPAVIGVGLRDHQFFIGRLTMLSSENIER